MPPASLLRWLLEEWLGQASWNFSQGAEWRLEKDRMHYLRTKIDSGLTTSPCFTRSLEPRKYIKVAMCGTKIHSAKQHCGMVYLVYPPIHRVSGRGKREKRKKKKERRENCSQIWRLSTNQLGDICQWLCKKRSFLHKFCLSHIQYWVLLYNNLHAHNSLFYQGFSSLEKFKMCCRLNKK